MPSRPGSVSRLPAVRVAPVVVVLAACHVLALAGCHVLLGFEAPAAAPDAGSCEAEVATDVDHCGACEAPCSSANGTPACAAGSCTITCELGFDDCDDDPRENGCEVDLGSDPDHCGVCGNGCPTEANTEATCAPGGQCGLECKPGFGNCETASADCETSLTANAEHCGACQHDCEGGPCAGSRCQAFDLTTSAFRPAQLAIDAAHVYFVRKKPNLTFELMRVAKGGGQGPELLASSSVSIGTIAVDGTYLYWSEGSVIRRIEKVPGGTPATVVPSFAGTLGRGFTVDDAFIYYCTGGGMPPDDGEGSIHKRATADPSTELLLTSVTGSCREPQVDATRVYWLAAGATEVTVYSASKVDGSDVQPLAATCEVSGAAQDASFLYYVASCTPGGPVTRVDKLTGLTTRLLAADETPYQLTVDDEHIYTFAPFVAQAIELRRYDKNGGGKVVLASTPIGTTNVLDFVHDADALYWSDDGRFTLRKLAK